VRLYVTGYRWVGYDRNMSSLPCPATPSSFEWNLHISMLGKQSDPFPPETRFICIRPEGDCWLAFGENPEAVVGEHPIYAGERLFYGVFEGHRLSVIAGDFE